MNLNMADIFTPEKRSWVMSQIKGKDTKIELRMRKMLADTGYRYNQKKRLAKKFWRDKIKNNMRRDRRYTRKIRRDGWSVLRLWEHDIEKNPEKCMRKILAKFRSR